MLLKDYSIDPMVRDNNGASAIDVAVEFLAFKNVEILKKAGVNERTVQYALKLATTILTAETDPNRQRRFQEIIRILSSGPIKKL